MRNVDSILAKLKEAIGCQTDIELAKALGGISPSTISTWKKRKTIPYDKIEEVSQRTTIPFSWFMADEEKGGGELAPVLVPILKQIASGFPEEVKKEDYSGYFSVPGAPKGAYALITQDEGMTPVIRQGDYLIFEHTQELKSGDLVVCQDEWGKVLTRRYREKDGHFFLVSENPEYPTLAKNERTKILGRVVDGWRKIKL